MTVPSPALAKKLKQLSTFRQTPYTDWTHPSSSECAAAREALESVHGKVSRPAKIEARDNVAAGCGQVPSVLDALVRTILSQNTSNRNSATAKRSMDRTFPTYDAVRLASQEELAEALAPGGLAKTKARVIKKLLDDIWTRNDEKRLSLEDLRTMDDEEAMRTLVSFDGVGPKTAACVLLFCLGKDAFPVDTHVFRITKKLGWVPKQSDRETAFQHLDARIPSEHKYALHSLLVRHGRACKLCSANGLISSESVACPLRPLMRKNGAEHDQARNQDTDIKSENLKAEDF